MSIVSNLKRIKWCTAELTDAKLRTVHTCTVHTCTVHTCIYSMLLCQLKMKLSKAWGFAQVNTAQKTSTVQLNGASLWCTALVVLALKTVLLPARILGDSMWNWVWCCDTLHRHRLGRYPLSHRCACGQGTQSIQPKTDVLHGFRLPLLFLSFLENNVGIDHGWLEEPPAKVSPPLHRGTTHRVVGMVLIHQINTPHVGVVDNDGLRNGDIFCPRAPGAFWVTEPVLASALVESTATALLSRHTVATRFPSWRKCTSPFFIFFICALRRSAGQPSLFTRMVEQEYFFFSSRSAASFTELKKLSKYKRWPLSRKRAPILLMTWCPTPFVIGSLMCPKYTSYSSMYPVLGSAAHQTFIPQGFAFPLTYCLKLNVPLNLIMASSIEISRPGL